MESSQTELTQFILLSLPIVIIPITVFVLSDWLLTYWVYQLARATQAVTMGEGTWDISKAHGELIVRIEKALFLDFEIALQQFVIVRPHLLWFFNKVSKLAAHDMTTMGFCNIRILFANLDYLKQSLP